MIKLSLIIITMQSFTNKINGYNKYSKKYVLQFEHILTATCITTSRY